MAMTLKFADGSSQRVTGIGYWGVGDGVLVFWSGPDESGEPHTTVPIVDDQGGVTLVGIDFE